MGYENIITYAVGVAVANVATRAESVQNSHILTCRMELQKNISLAQRSESRIPAGLQKLNLFRSFQLHLYL